VAGALCNIWHEHFDQDAPLFGQWSTWLARFSPDEIETSIRIAAGKPKLYSVSARIRYVSGILNNRRKEFNA
jgi:hypothetical protein